MLKKAGVLLLGLLLLVCIVLLLWGLALYKSWPLWYVPLICIVTLLVVFCLRGVGRRWYAWRLRRRMNSELPELRNFILPGGCQTSSFCHVARTVCRRAERRIVELSEKNDVDANLIKFINRLSDYLFVLSRKVSLDQKAPEILWSPEIIE